jgi:K+-transporting ATPase KdpF subunit
LFSCGRAKKSNPLTTTMENIIIGIISLGLIVYLLFTIVRPEKF